MKICLIIMLTFMMSLSALEGTAVALPPFKKAFDLEYVKKCDNEEFKKTFKKTGCFTCHIKKKKKDWLNLYGQEIAKLIPGNAKYRLKVAKIKGKDERKAENAKLLKELEVAFKKVGKLKSPSDVPYEELFKAHKLPTPKGAKSVKEDAEGEPEKEAAKK